MNKQLIRATTNDNLAAGVRLMLAMMFLMAGPMKLFVPQLAEAWSGQLLAAQIPFYELSLWSVPILELLLGLTLAVGFFARPAVVVVIGIMIVAIYVHIVVDNPALFPLQPEEPIIPPMVIGMSIFILWRGAGSWSLDGKS